MVSTWTGKMGDHFPVRKKSGHLNKRKSQEILHKILEKSGILALEKWNKHWKSVGNLAVRHKNGGNMASYFKWKINLENRKKILESQGNLSVRKSGNHGI